MASAQYRNFTPSFTFLLENKTSLNRITCKKIAFQILGSGSLLIILLSFIFLSTDPHNSNRFPYLERITNSGSLSIHQLFQLNVIKNRPIVKALFNPFEATLKNICGKKTNLNNGILLQCNFPMRTHLFINSADQLAR